MDVRLTSLELENFRSFAEMSGIGLGPVNVFLGPNNAGKSSLLRAVCLMQEGIANGGVRGDVRFGAATSQIRIGLADVHVPRWPGTETAILEISLNTEQDIPSLTLRHTSGGSPVNALEGVEPRHFVVPFLSRRKPSDYQEDVRAQYSHVIQPQLTYLAAKLSRIGNPTFPGHEQYARTCRAILGFVVTTVPSLNGQRPGVYLPDRTTLPIDRMGEGVPNIVGLLADLALSQGKLFVIEEPENDLHPAALKSLLDLMLDSSRHNQFLVSTHSNIVARHLGAAPGARLFYVNATVGDLPPHATVREVEPTPQARLSVLKELGYSLSDFELWDAWLILEESSAERIIRDYLIPWFVPRLSRIRSLAAAGVTDVEPTFDDFHRLVRFTHLEDVYRDCAWVRVDGDEPGRATVERLRTRYSTWTPERFGSFDQAQFENYYPLSFRERVVAVLGIPDKKERREQKRLLLNSVRQWLDEDPVRGRRALQESAASIIAELRAIEANLAAMGKIPAVEKPATS